MLVAMDLPVRLSDDGSPADQCQQCRGLSATLTCTLPVTTVTAASAVAALFTSNEITGIAHLYIITFSTTKGFAGLCVILKKAF